MDRDAVHSAHQRARALFACVCLSLAVYDEIGIVAAAACDVGHVKNTCAHAFCFPYSPTSN